MTETTTKQEQEDSFAKALSATGKNGSLKLAGSCKRNWRGVKLEIKHTLSLKEMLTFVDNVVKICFADDGSYLPEVKDFAIKKYIVEIYCSLTLPEDINECYEWLYTSDIVDFILSEVNGQQFEEIAHAIDCKLEHLAQANIEMVNKQINDLFIAFQDINDKISNIYQGVEPTDLKNLVSAISNGKISEEKLVDAFVKKAGKQ